MEEEQGEGEKNRSIDEGIIAGIDAGAGARR